jgi:hypothetical protein
LVAYLLDHGMTRKSVFRKKVGTAWPFRYRMAASYPCMIRELGGLRDRMRGLGIKLTPEWSTLAVLRNFDLFWKEYVLAKYIERVHRG